MKKYIVLYKKQIAVSVVLAVIVSLFAYTAYTVHKLSLAMDDNTQWKITATRVFDNHAQNIQQLSEVVKMIVKQLPAKGK